MPKSTLSQPAIARAKALIAKGDLPAAIGLLLRALKHAPQSDELVCSLGKAWLEAGEAAQAIGILSAITRGSPLYKQTRNLIAAAKKLAKQPRAPETYVRHLFDQFAPAYDRHMARELGYCAPRILRGLANLLLTEARGLAILDLGCGTGLSGAAFKDMATRLDGIDLSPGMLAAAKARGIYDRLQCADIETALRSRGRRYDLMLAADTLVYLGDLEPVLRGVRQRLKRGGLFLFTVERRRGQTFDLGPKRRYRHSEAYLRKSAEEFGFAVMGLMACSPRLDRGKPVAGFAAALQSI